MDRAREGAAREGHGRVELAAVGLERHGHALQGLLRVLYLPGLGGAMCWGMCW
ncbi:hypothetical protein [Delftia sp. 60]|uniref:hypothetical protein n=1 Tax=Delftia sp. 60 TaxID=2035216 RepID=UPI0015D516E5|nr:hypothetical protein [Delftia sp. 60]